MSCSRRKHDSYGSLDSFCSSNIMASEKYSLAHLDNETQITLGLLNAVHENSSVTQCSVAKELDIALGFANNY